MRSTIDYDEYYGRQAGGSMPYYVGARYQRGHGLGNIFAKVKTLLPTVLKTIGKFAIPTISNIATDMISGKKFREVAGTHALRGAAGALREIAPHVLKVTKPDVPIKRTEDEQKGSGKRKKRTRFCNDIFD